MLAWFARISRFGVFVLGLVLLAWLPASFFLIAGAFSRGPASSISIYTEHGHAAASHLDADNRLWDTSDFSIMVSRRYGLARVRTSDALWPNYSAESTSNPYVSYRLRTVRLPLWLLCALCLAWPMTYWIAQRRKRTRGFSIEG